MKRKFRSIVPNKLQDKAPDNSVNTEIKEDLYVNNNITNSNAFLVISMISICIFFTLVAIFFITNSPYSDMSSMPPIPPSKAKFSNRPESEPAVYPDLKANTQSGKTSSDSNYANTNKIKKCNLKIDNNLDVSILDAAKSYLSKQDADNAIACLNEIVYNTGNSVEPEIKWMLAYAYSIKNQFKTAFELMQQSKIPSPTYYHNLALLFTHFNMLKQAKQAWDKALSFFKPGDNEEFKEAILETMHRVFDLNEVPEIHSDFEDTSDVDKKKSPNQQKRDSAFDEEDLYDDDTNYEADVEDEEEDEENEDDRNPPIDIKTRYHPKQISKQKQRKPSKGDRFFHTGDFERALKIYEREYRPDDDNVELMNNMAISYFRSRRYEEGMRIIRKAIEIEPRSPYFYLTAAHGLTSQTERNCEHAMRFLRIAIDLDPSFSQAKQQLAHCLYYVGAWKYTNIPGWMEEADRIFADVIKEQPDWPHLYEEYFSLRNWIGKWKGYDKFIKKLGDWQSEQLDKYEQGLVNSHQVVHLFTSLRDNYPDEMLFRLAKASMTNLVRVSDGLLPPDLHFTHPKPNPKEIAKRRKRLGYMSGNLDSQPMGQLLEYLFKFHDRSKWEVWCFALSPDDHTSFRHTIQTTCEHFVNAHKYTWIELTKAIYNAHLDIMISLDGPTYNSREEVLTRRPVPIQMHFMGLPHSTGAPFIDYYLCDSIACPPESRPFFSEKMVLMPFSYYFNSYRYQYDPSFDPNIPSRQELRYPPNKEGKHVFVMGNFGIVAKIKPFVFDVYLRILQRAPESLLRLRISESARKPLLSYAKKFGIKENRFIFQDYQRNKTLHLQEVHYADVIVDTSPYNGHTTSSDSLWAGTPVVTVLDRVRMCSRVTASLLHSLDMDELICPDWKCFEDLVVEMALNETRYNEIRQKIAQNRLVLPTFDIRRWVSDLEKGLDEIIYRYSHNLPKIDITISNSTVNSDTFY